MVCQNLFVEELELSSIAAVGDIPGALREAGRVFGHKPWICDVQGIRPETRITFSEGCNRVLELAKALARIGLQDGDRFCVWMPNIHEWILTALGGIDLGAVLVPINTRFKGPEAGFIISKTRAKVLFVVDEFAGNNYLDMLYREFARGTCGDLRDLVVVSLGHDRPDLPQSLGQVNIHYWDDFVAIGGSANCSSSDNTVDLREPVGTRGESIGDIIFTSGTTGEPKGVMTTQNQTLRVFDAWSQVVGLDEQDRYAIVNPFFHTFGYKAGIIASILTGCSIYPVASFDVASLISLIYSEKITVLPGPPTLYSSILDALGGETDKIKSLRLAVTGAAVVPVELVSRMSNDLGLETVLTAYGLTESTGTVTMCRRGDSPETIANTCGRAIPGTQIKIIDQSGAAVPTGESGEVLVKGYNVMTGYFENDEQTSQAIDEDGWLHTGDVGFMDDRGYLKITDRVKDMFIVGGFNAYPAEIENILCSNENISQVAVVGVPDDRLGEVGRAFVILRPGCNLSESDLLEWSRQNMANYKVPRSIVFVDSLPMNASGKVLKNTLRNWS